MTTANVDQRISSFLDRKWTKFPELAISGRHESRTVKYALELRTNGQLLFRVTDFIFEQILLK
jgi:hypothetical protein